jgi:hypothetical protein
MSGESLSLKAAATVIVEGMRSTSSIHRNLEDADGSHNLMVWLLADPDNMLYSYNAAINRRPSADPVLFHSRRLRSHSSSLYSAAVECSEQV